MFPPHFLNLEHVICCAVKKLICVHASPPHSPIRTGGLQGQSLQSENLCVIEQITDSLSLLL